jgi:hypothetical protein
MRRKPSPVRRESRGSGPLNDAEGRRELSERLYSIAKAGELLGGKHPNDVRALVHAGKLAGKREIVRGTGKRPRLVIPASAIDRYIRSLPDATEPAKPGRAARAGRVGRGVAAELSQAKEYV